MIDEKEIEEELSRVHEENIDIGQDERWLAKHIAQFAQSKLIEKASVGFEEAWENSPFSSPDKEYALALWQASRLSLMAENEKLKKQVEILMDVARCYADKSSWRFVKHSFGKGGHYLAQGPLAEIGFEYAKEALAKLEAGGKIKLSSDPSVPKDEIHFKYSDGRVVKFKLEEK